MSDVRLSKRISWLLRHGANDAGLTMDAAGWAPIAEVLNLVGITAAQLHDCVRTNDKDRLVIADGRVRAVQGHSLAGTPVTADALEASWQPVRPTGSLWHGTTVEAIARIATDGLMPQRRSHVHLAEHADSRLGKRTNVDLLLEISPAELTVFRAPNGVLLTRQVPAEAIVDLRPLTPAGQRVVCVAREALPDAR